MADKKTYYLHGYDKDADVYETIVTTPSYDCVLLAGKAFIHYHMNVKEMRCTKTNEPFDWFMVSDDNGKPIMVFTFEHPEGIDSAALEQEE